MNNDYDLYEQMDIMSIVADLTNQRDKLLSLNSSVRKELETAKSNLIDLMGQLEEMKRHKEAFMSDIDFLD